MPQPRLEPGSSPDRHRLAGDTDMTDPDTGGTPGGANDNPIRARTHHMTIAPSAHALGPSARDQRRAVTVYLPSTVDIKTAHALRCDLLEALGDQPTRLIVDMSKVCSFDVTAAAVLVGVRRRFWNLGGILELTNVSANTASMLRQLGLARLLGC